MQFMYFAIVNMLRRCIHVFGGILLSNKYYQRILLQRAHAIAELVAIEGINLNPGIACVVFSKDRALQLHSLLCSYFDCVENPAPIFVIYTVSNEAHAQAYLEVQSAFSSHPTAVTFVLEVVSFRDTLLDVLVNIHVASVFFLVDDIIFIRPLNLAIAAGIDPRFMILSLRHSPHLRRSYTMNENQQPPAFYPTKVSSDLLAFNWFEQGCEWSDPWSVDGQILSTAEVRVISRISQFNAPNSYESVLKTFNDIATGRGGACFKESIILNLALNRVQDESDNRSGNVSLDFLLEQWNKGMTMDASIFDDHIPLSPHEVHEIKFKIRK